MRIESFTWSFCTVGVTVFVFYSQFGRHGCNALTSYTFVNFAGRRFCLFDVIRLETSLASMSVYCVLVIRAWTYEYGHERDYYIHVGGFYTGNSPQVSPCMCFMEG